MELFLLIKVSANLFVLVLCGSKIFCLFKLQVGLLHFFGNRPWILLNGLLTTNWKSLLVICYFGGARSKGFATLRNVSKLTFFDKIGHAKSVGFRFYSAIWRSESWISSRYLEITSISLVYSLTFSTKKELLIWLSRGLNRLTCVTRQIRGDSKLRD